MKVKAKCARALINLKEKESKRENSNELCKTKLYYATRRQRVCGQNKKKMYASVQRAHSEPSAHSEPGIWRSCAFTNGDAGSRWS